MQIFLRDTGFDLPDFLANIITFALCLFIPYAVYYFSPFRIRFRKGVKAIKNKKYDKAVKIFTRCIEKKPSEKFSYYNRSLAFMFLKKYDDAIKDAQASIRLYPFTYHPYFLMFLIYSVLKNYPIMLEYANKTLEFRLNKKKKAKVIYNRGITFSLMKEHEKSHKDYLEAIKLDKKFAEPFNSIGYNLNSRNQFNEALQYFDTSIKLKPDFAFAYNNRGFALAKLGRFVESFEDYKKSYMLDSENSYLFKNRGLTYYMTQKYNEALSDMEKAIEMEPDFENELRPFIDNIKAHYQKSPSPLNSVSH